MVRGLWSALIPKWAGEKPCISESRNPPIYDLARRKAYALYKGHTLHSGILAIG